MKYETLYTAVIANLDQLLQREDISVDESFALAEAMNLIEMVETLQEMRDEEVRDDRSR